MKANELMIGNWVYDGERTQFPMWVQTIGEDYMYLNFEGNEGDVWESTPEELQGIPLSHDLLIKIGFERSGARFYVHKKTYFELFDLLKGVYVATVNNAEYRIGKPIKYLHQLQNLYYSLEEEQLKIEF